MRDSILLKNLTLYNYNIIEMITLYNYNII